MVFHSYSMEFPLPLVHILDFKSWKCSSYQYIFVFGRSCLLDFRRIYFTQIFISRRRILGDLCTQKQISIDISFLDSWNSSCFSNGQISPGLPSSSWVYSALFILRSTSWKYIHLSYICTSSYGYYIWIRFIWYDALLSSPCRY